MSKGKTWQIDRHVKQELRRLEYVALKPLLWATEAKARLEDQASKSLSRDERYRFRHWLFWKYGGSDCAYCGRVMPLEALTIDHIQPRSKGGSVRDINNMVLACMPCNKSKGNSWQDFTLQS